MRRAVWAVVLCFVLRAAEPGLAAQPPSPATPPPGSTAVSEALRQASGAPGRVGLGDQASLRLSADLMFLPPLTAGNLLAALGRPVGEPNANRLGLLLASGGIDMAGFVQFVPAGFTDADAIRGWTQDDLLSSLRERIEQDNPQLIQQNRAPLEARAWVQPPRYDPATHQLAWAALIVPKTAPRDSDGEVIHHAVAFGRDGYITLAVPSSFEKAAQVERMTAAFLGGVNFLPGKGYADAGPQARPIENGVARAMGLDVLRKAAGPDRFWGTDLLLPVAGGVLAVIGILVLVMYLFRHMRAEARRG